MKEFNIHGVQGYTVIDNNIFRDKRISCKAKGLLCTMLSLPDEWQYCMSGLATISGLGRDALRTTLKELIDSGYVVVTKLLPGETTSGRIEYQYDVYARPVCTGDSTNTPSTAQGTEKQGTEKQVVEDPCLYKLNNNTHVVSKDTTFDTGHSQGSARSTTSSSGKLFSSEKPATRKSSVQKTNNFISACQREAIKKEFPKEVLTVLDDYFRMLAEMNCLLPAVSIAEQLARLKKVAEDRQVAVVKATISHGWKSLQYEAEATTTGGTYRSSSFVDTASPNTFKATPEEDKNGNWKKEIPDDQIF